MSGHMTTMSRGSRDGSSSSRPSRTSRSTCTWRAEPWHRCTWYRAIARRDPVRPARRSAAAPRRRAGRTGAAEERAAGRSGGGPRDLAVRGGRGPAWAGAPAGRGRGEARSGWPDPVGRWRRWRAGGPPCASTRRRHRRSRGLGEPEVQVVVPGERGRRSTSVGGIRVWPNRRAARGRSSPSPRPSRAASRHPRVRRSSGSASTRSSSRPPERRPARRGRPARSSPRPSRVVGPVDPSRHAGTGRAAARRTTRRARRAGGPPPAATAASSASSPSWRGARCVAKVAAPRLGHRRRRASTSSGHARASGAPRVVAAAVPESIPTRERGNRNSTPAQTPSPLREPDVRAGARAVALNHRSTPRAGTSTSSLGERVRQRRTAARRAVGEQVGARRAVEVERHRADPMRGGRQISVGQAARAAARSRSSATRSGLPW